MSNIALMTPRQACEFLQVSRRTLDRLSATGDLSFLKLGTGRSAPVRFYRSGLLADPLAPSIRKGRATSKAAEAELHRCLARLGGRS